MAHKRYSRAYESERQMLHQKLIEIMAEYGTTPDEIIWPKLSGADVMATQPDKG